MNGSIIRYIIGYVLKIEGLLLLLPCLTALICREAEGGWYLLTAAVCLGLGILMSFKKPKSNVFYLKEGCVATSLSWIVLSIFGCLPLWLTREAPSFVDALFEIVSGFTTTGASILPQVENLSHATLIWRSFTHWIGGMGVLVFLLAVVPLSGGSHINLMRAESPGPSVGKLVPKIKASARILYLIYFGMTALEVLLLLLGRMTFFEAVNTSFGTAGTGGFGFRNDSFASFSPYLQWVVTIFMILFGVNFNAYYLILYRKFKKALLIEEIRYYFLIIVLAVAFITVSLIRSSAGVFEALTQASFQVGSIITTTGFSTVDFDTWSQSCRAILVLLMFVGACAGSTGGGIKVSRVVVMAKTVKKELNSFIHPKSVKKIRIDGSPLEHEVLRSINVYLITYIVLFVSSVFLITLEGHDLVTDFTAVAATFNNIGPGLALVGPSQNFGFFSGFSKLVLIFDMLAGRLELFPLLILFHPGVWKEVLEQRKKSRQWYRGKAAAGAVKHLSDESK